MRNTKPNSRCWQCSLLHLLPVFPAAIMHAILSFHMGPPDDGEPADGAEFDPRGRAGAAAGAKPEGRV